MGAARGEGPSRGEAPHKPRDFFWLDRSARTRNREAGEQAPHSSSPLGVESCFFERTVIRLSWLLGTSSPFRRGGVRRSEPVYTRTVHSVIYLVCVRVCVYVGTLMHACHVQHMRASLRAPDFRDEPAIEWCGSSLAREKVVVRWHLQSHIPLLFFCAEPLLIENLLFACQGSGHNRVDG